MKTKKGDYKIFSKTFIMKTQKQVIKIFKVKMIRIVWNKKMRTSNNLIIKFNIIVK